jgi:hypothetical protein
VSYVDATGNLQVAVGKPALYLRDTGSDRDPWRGPGRPRATLQGPAAARVVRALVDHPPPVTVTELVARSRASIGATYRVAEFLEREALIERATRGRIVAVHWRRILERWSEDYGFQRSNTVNAYLHALDALAAHRQSAIVIGAQAIHLYTGAAAVGLAETTKDSDLALDTRSLSDVPLLEDAMSAAGFRRDPDSPQPGSWLNPAGIPVDPMVPETLAGGSGRRGASPAALLVAKLHKLGERQATPGRLVDKDAHDLYRLLVATRTEDIAQSLRRLQTDPLAGPTTDQGLHYLADLFAAGPGAPGSVMAGRAEEGIGEPVTVATYAAVLATDLLDAFRQTAGHGNL